jgi:hypothetical protein
MVLPRVFLSLFTKQAIGEAYGGTFLIWIKVYTGMPLLKPMWLMNFFEGLEIPEVVVTILGSRYWFYLMF